MRIDLTGTRGKVAAGVVGLAIVGVSVVAVAHPVHAAETQRGGGRGAWMGGPRGAGPAGALLPPLRRLDLTDEQREQVRTAIGESREAARTNLRETRAAREALAEATASATVDEDRIRTLAAELGRLAGDAAVRRAQVYAAVWRILTPEQQARAEEIRAEREERRNARRERMEERRERMRERREERRERRNQ
ncbi:MAG: Spy/CpxP family protein refolding chaperone [Acidobacteria bacterium]|nr:Spy/CpxP family protein refolding chaperone [Acidobacteriota bacterium]